MKKGIMRSIVVIGVAGVVSLALAEKSSVELGKKLFNDPALGGSTNSKTCNTCHPGGEGLEDADSIPNLAEMINRCITGPLQGDEINEQTAEMRSLKVYIQSLSK